ncbi:DNA primase [bacterium]|nr:DNA primase [bacterium]
MASSENFLAQLKAVVDPLTIFSHYLSLKKSGNRFKALCPFHSEKTPSFYAASNGMFHCFGCGSGGDVITFVMLMEKLDFRECIQLLSSRYGIPLKFTTTGERKEKDDLLDLMRQATDFYHNLLTSHESGKEALDHLEQRGITRETVKRFQLGWAPASWNSLLEHFQKRDVKPGMLEKCGLVIARQSEGYYDRYRSRIMIPIHDIHGNIIALGGRIFQGSHEEAKYLNSPESPVYSKSNQLFGLYFSKEHIQEKGFAILVEGYFDMIVPFQGGHQNVAASCGTSLTENQARLLRRYTDRIILFYDPDTAGKAAVMRALPILLRENFSVSVANLPEGLDPDSYIRQRGPEEFQNEIDRSIRYDQMLIRNLEQKYDLKSSTGKLAATEELLGFVDAIANPFEKIDLAKNFAVAMGVPPNLIQEQFRRVRKSTTSKRTSAAPRTVADVERSLLQIFCMDPGIAKEVLPEFQEEDLGELPQADLFRQLKEIVCSGEDLNTADLIHHFPPEVQKFLTGLIMEENTPQPSKENALDWLNSYIRPYYRQRQYLGLSLDDEEALTQRLELARESKRQKGMRDI